MQIGGPGGGGRIRDTGYLISSAWFARAVTRVYRALPESPSSVLSVLFPKYAAHAILLLLAVKRTGIGKVS